MSHVLNEHGFLTLPTDERNIVLHYARLYNQALWDSVPKARKFMICTAAYAQASLGFYGSLELSYPAYQRLADQLISELNDS